MMRDRNYTRLDNQVIDLTIANEGNDIRIGNVGNFVDLSMDETVDGHQLIDLTMQVVSEALNSLFFAVIRFGTKEAKVSGRSGAVTVSFPCHI